MEWAGPVGKATHPHSSSTSGLHPLRPSNVVFASIGDKKTETLPHPPTPINALLFTLRSLLPLLACEKVIDVFGRWTLWRLARGRRTNCLEHVSVILMSGGVRGWGQNKMGGEKGGVTATQQPRRIGEGQ